MKPHATAAWLICMTAACGTTWAAGKAHEHGVMTIDVVADGSTLSIALHSPLDSFLGFERAPRTDAERKAAAELLARLRSTGPGAPLFTPDAAARCTLKRAEVTAPALEAGGQAGAKDGHADLQANYEFNCAQPQQLRSMDTSLFDLYRRAQRIDVQVAAPQGQSKLTLKRPARSVKLVR